MFAYEPKPLKIAKLKRKEHEGIVNPNLAFDLSDLDAMRRRGQPISVSSAESLYYDGSETASFDFALDDIRGVDINDMWNRNQDIKRNMSKLGVSKVDMSSKN